MKNENFGLVLSTKDSDDKKTARIIGTDYFILMDLDLNDDVDVKVQDKIPLGKDSAFVKQERAHLSYDDLSKDQEFETEKAVHSIVIANEPKYVKFFNDQSKEASKLHFLDGISRKLGSKILTEKELYGDFESFEDITKRLPTLTDPAGMIVNRVKQELDTTKPKRGKNKYYLFTQPPRAARRR